MAGIDVQLMGKRVRELRAARGWTLRELSERCGISRTTISDVERGIWLSPGVEMLRAVAEGLGVSLDYLLAPATEEARSEKAALEARANAIAREWLLLSESKREAAQDYIRFLERQETR